MERTNHNSLYTFVLLGKGKRGLERCMGHILVEMVTNMDGSLKHVWTLLLGEGGRLERWIG